ncbi:lytic transglycosylase domain-containing protein [Coprothermobacteraceae bacterium]|nr:lytic transglycosylase domain-containing protein [Coprothermobacteraceae bacterium]
MVFRSRTFHIVLTTLLLVLLCLSGYAESYIGRVWNSLDHSVSVTMLAPVIQRTLRPVDLDNFPPYSLAQVSESEIDQLIDQRIQRSILKTAINRNLSDEDRAQMAACIVRYSNQYGVDPVLVVALIEQESGFNPKATSIQGATGLMQLMPPLYTELRHQLGLGSDSTDICNNLKAGIYYLSKRIEKWQNVYWALVAYFSGDGGVDQIKSQGKELYDKTGTSTQQYALQILGKLYENYLILSKPFPIPAGTYTIDFVVRFF